MCTVLGGEQYNWGELLGISVVPTLTLPTTASVVFSVPLENRIQEIDAFVMNIRLDYPWSVLSERVTILLYQK